MGNSRETRLTRLEAQQGNALSELSEAQLIALSIAIDLALGEEIETLLARERLTLDAFQAACDSITPDTRERIFAQFGGKASR